MEALETLTTRDSVLDAVRAQRDTHVLRVSPVVSTLVVRLRGLSSPSREDAASAAQREAEVAALLSPPQGAGEIGRLAHYPVRRVLAVGGMGVILEAEEPELHRAVAIKIIKPEHSNQEVVRRRFLREAAALAGVQSDHLVTIYHLGFLPRPNAPGQDLPFLVMELLHGRTLDHWLREVGRPSVAAVLQIGREIALALAAVHARGLVHRDVKPANVWLETRSIGNAVGSLPPAPAFRVKLLDFGLAQPGHGGYAIDGNRRGRRHAGVHGPRTGQ